MGIGIGRIDRGSIPVARNGPSSVRIMMVSPEVLVATIAAGRL